MAAEAASAVDETFVPLDGDASAARQASSSLEATGTESVGSCVQVSLKRATASYVCGYCKTKRGGKSKTVCQAVQGGPARHHWVAARTVKGLHCTVCRTGRTRTWSRCAQCANAVCEDCKPQAINNCRPLSAIYTNGITSCFFVEDSLPDSKSACDGCSKTCSTKGPATSYSCLWCQRLYCKTCFRNMETAALSTPCSLGTLAPGVLPSTCLVGVPEATAHDEWVKYHLNVYRSLQDADDNESFDAIQVYEGPNPRGTCKEYFIDGATRGKALLEMALKDFGFDLGTTDPKNYYLEIMRFSERQRRVTMGADFIAEDARRATEEHLAGNRSSVASAGEKFGVRLMPVADSPRPGVNARLHRQSRLAIGDESAPSTPEVMRKAMSPLPKTPNMSGGIQLSFTVKETKKVGSSTKVSAILKALRPHDDGTKAALFIRSSLNNHIVNGGTVMLKVFCDAQLPGRFPFVEVKSSFTITAQAVLSQAREMMCLSLPESDLYLEEVFCSEGELRRRRLEPSGLAMRSLLAHANLHVNGDSLRFFLRSETLRGLESKCSLHVTGFEQTLTDAEVLTSLEKYLARTTVRVTDQVALGRHGAATVCLEATSVVVEDVIASMRYDGLSVRRGLVVDIESIKPGTVPLLAFVNRRSGGGQGSELLFRLSQLLNEHQVIDLMSTGPLLALMLFRHLPEFRVIVAGGDGSVGWVLNALEDMREYLTCKEPAVGVLPVGTGNDLARVLGWGGGYSGEPLVPILTKTILAQPMKLDRWKIEFDCPGHTLPSWTMTNYFGIGLDAHIALGFHEKREAHPELFTGQLRNKMHYGQLGAKAMLAHPCKNMGKTITFTGDGEILKTSGFEGVVLLNISSFAGGASPWPGGNKRSSDFQPQSINDGVIEVFGISGIVHMSNIAGHLAHGTRIGQFSEIEIEMKEETVVQVDGEPFRQPPGIIQIKALENQTCMLRLSKELNKRVSQLFDHKFSMKNNPTRTRSDESKSPSRAQSGESTDAQ